MLHPYFLESTSPGNTFGTDLCFYILYLGGGCAVIGLGKVFLPQPAASKPRMRTHSHNVWLFI